jgi:hypothetical protein
MLWLWRNAAVLCEGGKMKVVCKKCGVSFEANNMSFDEVAYIQSLQCGVIGTHAVIGVNE